MNDADPFEVFLAAYADAVHAKDVAAFVGLYDDDLHVFDLWQDWSLQGLAAWRAMAEGWFASLGDERVVVTAAQAQGHTEGDLAFGHAFLTYAAYAADGRRLRSLDNRISVAMRRTAAGWKVVHEHTSVPVEHGSGRALMRRED